ncbi:MAG: GGDEF domain-containing protein [Lachnospiraceae bacterium]|nr:GGDEF domain-containing protein [Lachnospiraceae bacterium]
MAGKRYNIGLVTGNVEDDFPNQICEGAIQAAAELDDNLFIVPVKYFDRYDFTDPLQKYEYQYNTLISYAQVHSLDIVLLCLGNISAIHETRSAEIINGFGDIPIILIASEQDGYSSVCYANEAGLTEGIEALVTRENREHIGIITGYTTNKDSYERLETYKKVLQAHNLPIDESLICCTYFDEKCRADAAAFIDNNPDLDAIVCGNDAIAAVVYDLLQKRGILVGKDISVIGFDDIPGSKYLTPPLASVKASAYDLGSRAVMQAHRKLLTGTMGQVEQFRVSTKFLYRSSLGSGCEEEIKLQNLLDEQDKLIENVQQAENSRKLIMTNHNMNIFSRDMLMLADDSDDSYLCIMNSLTEAGIKNSYLFTLKEPVAFHPGDNWIQPNQIYLRACLNDGRAFVPRKTAQLINIQNIYDHPHMSDTRNTYVMIDLYSRDLQYGFLLCDIGYDNLHYVEYLCYQVSIAIKFIYMFAKQHTLLLEKDEMLQRLQKENLQLDSISGKDELTGILNRRGFYKKADAFIESAAETGQSVVFAYADLNYLKQINDIHGHAEGDFALTSCATVLEEVFPGSLTGRIGGDEFAVLALHQNISTEADLKKLINQKLAECAEKAGKPYSVTLSVGIYMQPANSRFLLKDAIEAADALLYEEKKKKPPFVTGKP